jgi:hypothetical protein
MPFFASAQNKIFDIRNISFSLSPKILEDGSITDINLGLRYTEKLSSEFRYRFTTTIKNEELLEVRDSLNAVDEKNKEIYLIPVRYSFINTIEKHFWIGGGVFYEYNKLKEKGFFNMPELEDVGRERVNSYINNFSMHVIGPLFDIGLRYQAKEFETTITGGVIPIFYLNSVQKMGIVPLIDPSYADYIQNTVGTPYFYLNLDFILFKYINLIFLYDLFRLNYKVIDFDENLNWFNPRKNIIAQSLKLEASVLIPLGGNMSAHIGYGYTFDFTQLDSNPIINNKRQYIIFTVKKRGA